MKTLSAISYTAGALLLAGTVGNADAQPYAPITEFIATAAAGFSCIGLGALLGREKAVKVEASIEVLTPVGGTYCRNPYYTR